MTCQNIGPQIKLSPLFSSVKKDFLKSKVIFIFIQSAKHQSMDLLISVSAFGSNNFIDVSLNERRSTFYQLQYWRRIPKAIPD